ncbi:MAG: polymer-forming cytoskeletal protein [Alphaproteobacteria bacterium]|jgi:cytoskeletal protein CcmA (bactofilin family)|nr:polymer-forming cytoskeletal protein [Alphaproteobacteria bacterium]
MFNKTEEPASKGVPMSDSNLGQPPAAAPTGQAEASLISAGLKVVGNLESDGDVVIAGTVEGDIAGRGLTVRAGARVVGAIDVDTVHILGVVEGKVTARSVHIAESGEMTGDVLYEKLAIDEGAMLDGQCRRNKAGGSTVSKLKTVDGGAKKAEAPASAAKGSGQKAS